MREVAALAAVLAGAILVTPRPSFGTYENARSVGRSCASCHSSTKPGPDDLNETGRYFLVERKLPGAELPGLQEAPPAGVPGGPPRAADPVGPAPVATTNEASPGAEIYERACAVCHGAEGEGTAVAKPLTGALEHGAEVSDVATAVRTGVTGTSMFAFEELLTAAEIEAVASHVVSLRDHRESPASSSTPPRGTTVRKEDP